MKHRDDMTQAECDALLKEIQRLDALYDNVPCDQPTTPEMQAAYEQSLEYFNRYIAGDRK